MFTLSYNDEIAPMSKLTDAIKQNDIATALDLINGTSVSARFYRACFEFWYGSSLLDANENNGNYKYSDNALPGYTPLYLALANGHDDIAASLIEAGANVTDYTKVDPTCFNMLIKPPMDICWLPSYIFLEGYLDKDYNNAASIIFVAVDKCSPATIIKLAHKGAKISSGIFNRLDFHIANYVDYGGGSILMKAILSRDDNDVDIIKCLLELGADPNKFIRCRAIDTRNDSIPYAKCHTALSLAVETGKIKFAKVLMQYGATLWPTKFRDDHLSRSYTGWNWFEVNPETIATAQQIATEIGVHLQPPEKYENRYGELEWQNSIPNQQPELIEQPRLVQDQPELLDDDALIEDQQRAREAGFVNNAYLRFSRILGFASRSHKNIIATVRATIGNIERYRIDHTTEIGKKLATIKRLDPTFNEDSLLHCFRCPISGEVIREPVTTEYNHTYDRLYIAHWLSTSNIDPMSGRPLNTKLLRENLAIKQGLTETLDLLIATARNNAQLIQTAHPNNMLEAIAIDQGAAPGIPVAVVNNQGGEEQINAAVVPRRLSFS